MSEGQVSCEVDLYKFLVYVSWGVAGVLYEMYGQKTTGHKTTGQKTTKNANPRQKTIRTKGHHRRNVVVYFDKVYNELYASKKLHEVPVTLASAQTDMFAVEYRSDNTSDLHCRLIKSQYQTERLCLSRQKYISYGRHL